MAEIIKIKYQISLKNTEIAANGSYEIPIPKAAVNTHHFFNDLAVINTSSNLIEVTPDHDSDRSFFVPAKSIMTWSFRDDNMRFSSLKVTDKEGAIVTADLVQCIIIKKRFEVV